MGHVSNVHKRGLKLVNFKCELDLESLGSSLGFEGELIWAGLDWRGPDIRSGLVNRQGQERSKSKEKGMGLGLTI